MKTAGIVLTVLGAIGLIVSGINYANNTESLDFFGAEVTISQGSFMPLIISGIILLVGIVLTMSSKK